MKKLYSSLIFLQLSSLIVAQIPPGYYNSAAGLSGTQLQLALHNIIDGHTTVSYSSLWNHFETTDKKSNGKVWDIYSDVPGGTPPYQFTFTTDQCGSYGGEGDCFNREHSWPQSWFNSATVPSSDLFHMYPTDGYVNNRRSNYPYGTVGASVTWTSLNGSKLGYCSDPGYASLVFEPIDEYKGDVARSFFYMSTRYLTEDGSWTSSGGTNKSALLPWEASVLLQWHHMDTVSTKEIARNNAIYGIQNNRNPFIDNPQWADSIWTIIAAGIDDFNMNKIAVSLYPNPSNEFFYLKNTSPAERKMNLKIYDLMGQEINSPSMISLSAGEPLRVNCEKWASGVYFITIIENNTSGTFRFVKL